MGMFDSLRDKLKGVAEKAADEVELKEAKPKSDDELEAELDALLAEVDEEIEDAEEFEVVTEAPAEAEAPPARPEVQKPAPEPAVEKPAPEPEVEKPAPAPAPEREVEKPVPEPEVERPAEPEPAPEPAPTRETPPTPAVEEPTEPTHPVPEVHKPAPRPEIEEPAPQPEVEAPAAEAVPEYKAAPRPQVEKRKQQPGKAINMDKIEDLLWDLELTLLESDVALDVVEAIKERLKTHLADVRVDSTEEVPQAVEDALRQSMLDVLSAERIDFDLFLMEKLQEKKPVVVMFVGVNGTGKTTAIGRVAYRLKESGFTCVLAAGDTFRAGAIEQLGRHGDKLGVTVIKHQHGGDPAAVAYDAIEHAKNRMKDVVLLDTAGRMQTNTNLMDEMKKIKRVGKPDLIVFVGDSLAGNDAVDQAVKFNEAVGVDAAILTKVDTDAKGGAALSIAHAVGKPLLFLGVGQDYADLIPYDPNWMVQRIFES